MASQEQKEQLSLITKMTADTYLNLGDTHSFFGNFNGAIQFYAEAS